MKRWQKWALGITLPAMALGAVGYAKRTDLVLALAARQMSHDIAPNRPIPWQQGPDKAAQPIEQRHGARRARTGPTWFSSCWITWGSTT